MFEWYWVFLFYIFALHIKAFVITIYLHRGITHRSLEFSKPVDETFKFLIWMVHMYCDNYKQVYRAIHIKHHVNADAEKDTHSPYHHTIKQMWDFDNVSDDPNRCYYLAGGDLQKYGGDEVTPKNWLDKHLYHPYQKYGLFLWYIPIFFLYGYTGLLISLFIFPFIMSKGYAFVGNYVYHKFGYITKGGNRGSDKSRNLLPIGIIFCGEELHSNHHSNGGRPKFSMRWFEFDMGWVYIRILSFLGLVRIKNYPIK